MLETGVSAFNQQQYAQAFEIWLPLAENNQAEAQLFVAYLFSKGLGVEQNPEQAFYWYKKAADQQIPEAQYQLGLFYEIGQVVQANADEANYWYGLAVDQDFCPGELSASGRLLAE